ncbi:MAG: class I SAM-dependent methyltransferase [Anaerolineales bacterium]
MVERDLLCRSCGQRGLQPILSLGHTPLANSLLPDLRFAASEEKFPLDLVFCPHCSLVQITETIAPEKLFRQYLYFSSFSDTMLRHAQELATEVIGRARLHSGSLVVEIASNDGYLLQYYQQENIPVLGIEPALNVARVAQEERGIPTLAEFFGLSLAEHLREEGKQADVIHAHNVLAHVADLNGFVAGIGVLLKGQGMAIIEAPYVKEMIDRCEFDTIYHEHLCYFSLTALDHLFRRHGMTIFDVKRVPIHGGSLRIYVRRSQIGEEVQSSVTDLLEEESGWGVKQFSFYEAFARRVQNLKASLTEYLKTLKEQGKRLAAYGASAKGSTLLNYFGIGTDILDFVVDRSTYKQGHYMPGVHLPIYAPEKLLSEMPDYALLLVWNFADEILSQQQEYLRRGGHFIIPIPEVTVI